MNGPGETRLVFWNALIGVICVLALARLAGFTARFGHESLQRDFAAFYTAGEALQHGLSPYRTHADHVPPIWDGIDAYRHSRFLYPPLVASLFKPLAFLPYAAAKRLWMLFGLTCLGLSVWLFVRALGLTLDRRATCALAALIALFHPLLAHLETGQIDAVTLLLVSLGVTPLIRGRKGGPASGAILAAATLLKLNVCYLALFLLIRRKWRVLTGYVLGAFVLLLTALAVNGPTAVREYVLRELPRITRFGERGTSEMLLDGATLARLRSGAPEGRVIKDGRAYRESSFEIVANASLARIVAARLARPRTRIGEHRATSTISLVIIGLAGLVAGIAVRRRRDDLSRFQETTYWLCAMTAVLLAGPLTWVMNLVWLLPLAVLILGLFPRLSGRRESIALAGCALGLLLAALPDRHSWALIAPFGGPYATWQFVAAEIVMLLSLLMLLRVRPTTESERRRIEANQTFPEHEPADAGSAA
ncbi:MAG: DUF2029 domain-containing protein [Vicinamibacteria bacterium]|nr:DUF2029 domain-containing protein [Vicinamibacteria bacterium]